MNSLHCAFCASLAIYTANALTILAPTAGERVNLSDVFTVKWQKDSDEASVLLSIDLVNATAAASAPVLLNIARNVSSTVGDVNVTWPLSVPNTTAAYQLYFLSTASGSDIATSATFNLTLPPGENRTESGSAAGPINPAVTAQGHARKQGLSGGAIAGIVVGVCVGVLAVLVAAWLFWRRAKKRREMTQAGNEKQDKPELDGVTSQGFHKRNNTVDTELSAELSSQDHKERIDSHEMEGSVDYLRFELPSTPPPPAELEANELAAEEMDAGFVGLAGPNSALLGAPRASSIRSSSTTLGGTRTFAEALHDLVSSELRRAE